MTQYRIARTSIDAKTGEIRIVDFYGGVERGEVVFLSRNIPRFDAATAKLILGQLRRIAPGHDWRPAKDAKRELAGELT